MKKPLLTALSLLAMVVGWTSAFLLGGSWNKQYAWLLPSLLIGIGVGLSLRFYSGRRTALLLAASAALSMGLATQLSPGSRNSLENLKRLVGLSEEFGRQEQQLQVPLELSQPPFDRPVRLSSVAMFGISLWARLPAGVDDICFAPDGALYVSLPELGAIYKLGEGRVARRSSELFLHSLEAPTGLVCRSHDLVVSQVDQISAYPYTKGKPTRLVGELPVDGGNLTHSLLDIPGGLLFSVGSRCDACAEKNPLRGTLQLLDESGSLETYARGLRAVGGLARNPADESIWGSELSRQFPSPGAPDEINRLRKGADYGWPFCEEGLVADENCRAKVRPELVLKQRANPGRVLFARSLSLPAIYQNSLLMVLHGDPTVKVRPAVVRVPFAEGNPMAPVAFVDGWDGVTAGPSALAAGPDGALYIGDAINGAIYRFVWHGGG